MQSIIAPFIEWSFPIALVATFAVTLLFSTKIKDFAKGIPSDLRSGLSAAETATVAKVKAAQASVIASVVPAPTPVLKPAAPAAPVAHTGPTGAAI